MGSTNHGALKALPAEIRAGLVFNERFESAAEVVNNAGTLYALPTVSNGLTVNGTTQGVGYPCIVKQDASFTLSFMVTKVNQVNVVGLICAQRKAATDGFVMYFNNSNDIYFDYRDKNGTTYSIITTTDTFINGKYLITIRYDKTAAKIDILQNGIVRGTTAVASGMNVDASSIFEIAKYSIYFMTGTIHYVQLFQKALSDSTIVSISDGTIWNYDDNCVLWMDGKLRNYDPTNNRHLDASGAGNHLTFGATTKTPAKMSGKKGYTLDADAQFIVTHNSKINDLAKPLTPKTVAIFMKTALIDNRVLCEKGTNNGCALQISSAGKLFFTTNINPSGLLSSTIVANNIPFLGVGVYDGASTIKVYVNGVLEGTLTNAGQNGGDENVSNFVLGARDAYPGTVGDIYCFCAYNIALNQLQIIDLYIRMSQDTEV